MTRIRMMRVVKRNKSFVVKSNSEGMEKMLQCHLHQIVLEPKEYAD